jgi:glycosyltransferase involved in cell wall biosynthesis
MSGAVAQLALRRGRRAGRARLRLLFVYGGWLRPELGAARGILDVADAFAEMGHDVSTYSFENAFPDERVPRYPWVDSRRRFAARACSFVRAHAHEFDVIDANEGCLPYSKDDLGFDGVLVANSCGLVGMYHDYIRYERRRWRSQIPGLAVTRVAARLRQSVAVKDALRSLRNADLVRVLNPDELEWAAGVAGVPRERLALAPLGVSVARRAGLQSAGANARERLARKEVLFIGTWTLRKGRADIPAIVDAIVWRVPAARFHFAGTYEEPELRAELARHVGRIRVSATYPSHQLPGMLAEATVVMAPSYVEGFHLGVLEALVAGVPVAAYDIPGPRFMLSRLDARLLVPRGDVEALASRVAELLTADPREYVELCAACRSSTSELASVQQAERMESRLFEFLERA